MITPASISPGELSEYVGNYETLIKLLGNVKEAIYLIDPTEIKPVYASKSLLHLLGYSETQIKKLGTTWPIKLTHPDDYSYLSQHIANYKNLLPSSRTRVVYRLKDPSGKWRVIESTSIALGSEDADKTQLIVGITRELSFENGEEYSVTASSHEHRCTNCKKLLGKERAAMAEMEVKCSRCGEFNQITTNHIK